MMPYRVSIPDRCHKAEQLQIEEPDNRLLFVMGRWSWRWNHSTALAGKQINLVDVAASSLSSAGWGPGPGPDRGPGPSPGPGVWSRPDADLLLDNDGLRLPLRLLFNDQFVGHRLRCVPPAFSSRLAWIVGFCFVVPQANEFLESGCMWQGLPFCPWARLPSALQIFTNPNDLRNIRQT